MLFRIAECKEALEKTPLATYSKVLVHQLMHILFSSS